MTIILKYHMGDSVLVGETCIENLWMWKVVLRISNWFLALNINYHKSRVINIGFNVEETFFTFNN